MSNQEKVEDLLRSALSPVDPPEKLSDRFERRLSRFTEAAAGELADWELKAMRDPRRWLRISVVSVAGGVAGACLIVIRARQAQRRRAPIWKRSKRSARALANKAVRRHTS